MSQRVRLLLRGKARRRWRMGSRRLSSWRVVMRAQILGTVVAAAGKLGIGAVEGLVGHLRHRLRDQVVAEAQCWGCASASVRARSCRGRWRCSVQAALLWPSGCVIQRRVQLERRRQVYRACVAGVWPPKVQLEVVRRIGCGAG